MALAVPGLELGLEGLPGGMGTPVGGVSLGHLSGARADEDERRRRLGQVMDILKVGALWTLCVLSMQKACVLTNFFSG